MSKFEFKLETVLKIRKIAEKKAKIALSEAINFMYEIENEIKNNNQKIEESYERRKIFSQQSVSIHAFILEDLHCKKIQQNNEKLKAKLEKTIKLIEKAKKTYQYTNQAKKTVENIKDKKRVEFLNAEKKIYQKKIDDLVLVQKSFTKGTKDE